MPEKSPHCHTRGTGNNPGEDAQRLTIAGLFQTTIGDQVKVVTTPLRPLTIHLGHSVFAETSFAWRETPRGQQPMKVRSDTDSMCLAFMECVHGTMLSSEIGGSGGSGSSEYGGSE